MSPLASRLPCHRTARSARACRRSCSPRRSGTSLRSPEPRLPRPCCPLVVMRLSALADRTDWFAPALLLPAREGASAVCPPNRRRSGSVVRSGRGHPRSAVRPGRRKGHGARAWPSSWRGSRGRRGSALAGGAFRARLDARPSVRRAQPGRVRVPGSQPAPEGSGRFRSGNTNSGRTDRQGSRRSSRRATAPGSRRARRARRLARSAPPPTCSRRSKRSARRSRNSASDGGCSSSVKRWRTSATFSSTRPRCSRYPSALTTRSRSSPRQPRSSGSSAVQMRPSLPLASTRRRKSARVRVEGRVDVVPLAARPDARCSPRRTACPARGSRRARGRSGSSSARAAARRGVTRARTPRRRTARPPSARTPRRGGLRSPRGVGVSPKAKFSSVGTSSRHAKSSQMRRLAVAAGAADLLRVALEALRQVVVVDVADVGLVDPHAERDRRDDDVRGRARPPLLHLDAVLGVHAGVVGARGEAGLGEQGGDTLRRALQRDVDDRRARRAARAGGRSAAWSRSRASDRRGEQRQVRSVEAGDDGVAPPRSRSPRRCRRRPRGSRSRSARARARRRARVRAPRASGSRGGSCGPTRRCSAPRRPRRARSSSAPSCARNRSLLKRSGAT